MSVDLTTRKAEIHRQNAEFFGKAARLAYKDADTIDATLQKWDKDMRLVKFFDFQDTQAYLAKNNEACILAFRGTQPNNLHDWLYDLDGFQVKGPVGKVHRGFLRALQNVWDDLRTTLDRERAMRSLWITGHSLGGALAVLAAARLRFENQQPINGLYTFGQPRVGDAEFCSLFDRNFPNTAFRFVNFHDIVPRVPMRSMGFGDLGSLFYFNENKYDPETTWDKVLARKVGDTIRQIVDDNTKDITDHMMDNYLKKLKSLADFSNFHDV